MVSKAHALAGVRVGYAIADPEVIGAIQSLLVPFGVNSLALAAALASLADAEAVQRAVAEIVAERERIVPALRELGYDIPDTQSNFYLLRGSVYGLVDACARVGLIVRPFREGVRVSVGSREQNDRFLFGRRRLRARRGHRRVAGRRAGGAPAGCATAAVRGGIRGAVIYGTNRKR